jgi:hypothetical protein
MGGASGSLDAGAFLASGEARYVAGMSLPIDAGVIIK